MMRDRDDDIDPSIYLEPIEPIELTPVAGVPFAKVPPRRGLLPYVLVGGAIVLSLSAALAVIATIAARINGTDRNVTAADQRDRSAERAESVLAFRDFDARNVDQLSGTTDLQRADRKSIEEFFNGLETIAAGEDAAGFREQVDFDRLLKRIELTGNLWNYSGFQRRSLRGELKNWVEPSEFWKDICVTAIVAPEEDPTSRIVYAVGKTSSSDWADVSQFRFWIARDGDSWKLYDWEQLELGLSLSREWGLLAKYYQTPEMAGYERWSTLVSEASNLAGTATYYEAKEKLRQAEREMCPAELSDYRWLLTGYHWVALNEPAEAKRCYYNIQRRADVPGVYDSLMQMEEEERPEAALEFCEQFETTIGPHPQLLSRKADLLSRLDRPLDAVAARQQQLQMEPENITALADFFVMLPDEAKTAFTPYLNRAEDPARLASEVAGRIGYRDYPGLAYFVVYLDEKAAGTPYAQGVAGLAKQLDGRHGEAAALFRQAFENVYDADRRDGYVAQYLEAMIEDGRVAEAASIVPEPAEAIGTLIGEVEEDYIALSDEEYQQLLEVYAKRCPESVEPLVYQAQWALAQDRYEDAERLSRAVLAKIGMEAAGEGEIANDPAAGDEGDVVDGAENDDYNRATMIDTLATSLYRQKRLEEASQVGSDPKKVFSTLARLAVADHRWDDARQLAELHRAQAADDPWLHYVDGELAAKDGDWDAALRHFHTGWKASEDGMSWPWKERLLIWYVKTDRWPEYYRQAEDRAEAFRDLANQLLAEENWSALGALMHEHQLDFPADPRIVTVQAEAAWMQGDWAAYGKFAEQALKCRDEAILPSYQRDIMQRRQLTALWKAKSADAATVADRYLAEGSDPALSALAALAKGDTRQAEQFARKTTAATESARQLYMTDFVGEVFLGPEFREFQQDYPVTLPPRGAPSVAVFLFDKPWKLEAADVDAAFAALGTGQAISPQPIRTFGGRVTRGFVLRLDEGSIWIVCGKGKFNGDWKLDADVGPLADAVNGGESWLAVGTAGWTERSRDRLGPMARKLAQKLAGDAAGALCVSRYDEFDYYVAMDPALAANEAWLKSGSIATIADEGFDLETSDRDGSVVNDRRAERSLREAVRKFEATPGSKLEVWASLSDSPRLDPLRLQVSKVARAYGGLNFQGALADASVVAPQLVEGLPMQIDQDEVCAWRIDGGEMMYREP